MKFLVSMLAVLLLIPALPALGGDIEDIPACQYCGMDRNKFGQTRMLIEYEKGSRIGVCSIHDAAVDLSQSISKTIKTIWVADYSTRKLIDAEQAAWVIGGDLPGVMSGKSRVAFAGKAEASAFRKEHGGETVSFDEAIDDTFRDMWKDIKMIREKRAKMKQMKGMKGM
jgi:nitrous oxide reductase accessory protein NosL